MCLPVNVTTPGLISLENIILSVDIRNSAPFEASHISYIEYNKMYKVLFVSLTSWIKTSWIVFYVRVKGAVPFPQP